VLDEPTFGQDSRTWKELVRLLAELLDSGTAVLAVTHDEHFVAALADVRFTLSPGSGGATGTPTGAAGGTGVPTGRRERIETPDPSLTADNRSDVP
jgi:energy-coupling factor transporter ATP-binding protein EcfA2